MDRFAIIEKFAAKMSQERREDLSSKANVKKVEQGGIGKGSCAGVKMAAMADELEKIAATEAKLKRMAQKIDTLRQKGEAVPAALEDAFKTQMKKWKTLSGPRLRARAPQKAKSVVGGLKQFGRRGAQAAKSMFRSGGLRRIGKIA